MTRVPCASAAAPVISHSLQEASASLPERGALLLLRPESRFRVGHADTIGSNTKTDRRKMANEFKPGKLITALRSFELNAAGKSDDFLVGAPKDLINNQLYELELVCQSADLKLSLLAARRIRALLTASPPMKYGEVKPLFHDFFHRIADEIESARFFAVPE
jgi:hypothetical protein